MCFGCTKGHCAHTHTHARTHTHTHPRTHARTHAHVEGTPACARVGSCVVIGFGVQVLTELTSNHEWWAPCADLVFEKLGQLLHVLNISIPSSPDRKKSHNHSRRSFSRAQVNATLDFARWFIWSTSRAVCRSSSCWCEKSVLPLL